MTNRKKFFKNKFDNAIINHMIYCNIISKKRHNYVLKIAIYIKLVVIAK